MIFFFPLLDDRSEVEFGETSSLSGQQAREGKRESLVPRCVRLFCAMVVLLAKWGCGDLLQHLGLLLVHSVSV